MQPYYIPIWKTAPFLRLVLPLVAGIAMQWYLQFSIGFLQQSFYMLIAVLSLFYFIPIALKYRLRFLQGFLMMFLLMLFGMLITWKKDLRHNINWFNNYYNDSSLLIIKLNEPLVEKPGSFKAEAVIDAVVNNLTAIPACGKITVYFSKDDNVKSLKYGDRLLINKCPVPIRNAGNPGAFNYERYAAFQQTFHTAYLKTNNWSALKTGDVDPIKNFIFTLRAYVILQLHIYINSDKNVLGIAEALLIGYREDLDRELLQAYSNAGVVHIIAISGLHLGLIYVILVWIFNRLPFVKKHATIKVVLVLSCLWIFSLLTGASASVLRSAVMFSCIVIGKNYFKQSSIYNSLAASAFILLCYDPYFLWDVGFQLSYLAVIGIVSLQKSINSLLFFKSGMLKKIWAMLSVTLAAQLITLPVCIYYFHQFPNLFFITNLVAVPMSTLILFTELFLIAFSWLPSLAIVAGKLAAILIWLMNLVITTCNKFPFAVMENMQSGLFSTWVLYGFIISLLAWLLKKQKVFILPALLFLLLFVGLHLLTELKVINQKKIVIYNVPKQQAIDFISGSKFIFLGDSVMLTKGKLKDFYLKPARISMQITPNNTILDGFHQHKNEYRFFNNKMILIDTAVKFIPLQKKIPVDILLISKNPSINISDLTVALNPAIIVFDASNSLWKIANWKKQCLVLALPCFSVPEQGAFVMNIN